MQASKELSVDPTEPNVLVEENLTQHLLPFRLLFIKDTQQFLNICFGRPYKQS